MSSRDQAAAYSWTFFCGHTTVGGNECADACPECGETDLVRKASVDSAAHVHDWIDTEGPNRICRCGHIEPIPQGDFALGRSAAQDRPKLGITMAEAQRRAALLTKIVRKQGVSITPAIRKDRERRGR